MNTFWLKKVPYLKLCWRAILSQHGTIIYIIIYNWKVTFFFLFHSRWDWDMSSEKVPSDVCKMRRFRSSGTCTKYHVGLYSPMILHSVVSNHSVSGQGRLCSNCQNVQADLGLCWPHMPIDTFSYGEAQTNLIITFLKQSSPSTWKVTNDVSFLKVHENYDEL